MVAQRAARARACAAGLGTRSCPSSRRHRLRAGHRVRRHRSPCSPSRSVEEPDRRRRYADYYGFITSAIVVFIAVVGPEVLCTDRRTGMLGLYLASPLTATPTWSPRRLSIASVLLIVTLGPPLLLLIGFTLEGHGPDGSVDFVLLLLRIVGAGVAVAVLYTALVAGACRATTDRDAPRPRPASSMLVIGDGHRRRHPRGGRRRRRPTSCWSTSSASRSSSRSRIYGETSESERGGRRCRASPRRRRRTSPGCSPSSASRGSATSDWT